MFVDCFDVRILHLVQFIIQTNKLSKYARARVCVCVYIYKGKKIKFALEQATKAQRCSSDIAVLFLQSRR